MVLVLVIVAVAVCTDDMMEWEEEDGCSCGTICLQLLVSTVSLYSGGHAALEMMMVDSRLCCSRLGGWQE